MQISSIRVRNFRGLRNANLNLNVAQVFLGDNNTGKTTILEAVDLALGPDRLNRFPAVDEHDFHLGKYLPDEGELPIGQQIQEGDFSSFDRLFSEENKTTIAVLVQLNELSEEQKTAFGGRCEFVDEHTGQILEQGSIDDVDGDGVTDCLRILFLGHYDAETDDFVGKSYYYKELLAGKADEVFKKAKQLIGFLYLRSLRTGSRALSLERGSLLDIVLRTCNVKPQMWENVLDRLEEAKIPIDEKDQIGEVLSGVQNAINRYVPKEWGSAPKLKVSRMTREDLRRTIVSFVETQDGHNVPFFRQGTGTANMLVLALLSIIRDNKQNVIFAMEEPETAVPPNVQKQIVSEVVANSDQAVFTSHSPYVIEEFSLDQICVLEQSNDGDLSSHEISIGDPGSYNYHQFFRTQLCEGLLARRVIVCEGATEVSILVGLSRHLENLDPEKYGDLAALGFCMVNAQTDSQILNHLDALGGLGKYIAVFCDAQDEVFQLDVELLSDNAFMHGYSRVEDLLIGEIPMSAKERFNGTFVWPAYVVAKVPDPSLNLDEALRIFLKKSKASGGAVALLEACTEGEVPQFLKGMVETLTAVARPQPEKADEEDHGA